MAKQEIKFRNKESQKIAKIIRALSTKVYGTRSDVIGTNNSYKFRCPFHSDEDSSFSIHKTQPIGKCFGCSIYFTSASSLLRKARSQNLLNDSEVLEYAEKVGVDIDSTTAGFTKKYTKLERATLTCFKEMAEFFADEFINNRTSFHTKYLSETRRLDMEFLEGSRCIGIIPPITKVDKFLETSDLKPAVQKNLKDYLAGWVNGYVFPIETVRGEVIGFKIRTESKDRMNIVLASKLINSPNIATRGFVGLRNMSNKKYERFSELIDSAVMVEGEFDMLQMQWLISRDISSHVAIGYALTKDKDDLTELRELGIKNLYFVPDNDQHSFNQVVGAGVAKVLRSLNNEFSCYIYPLSTMISAGAKDMDGYIQYLKALDGSDDLLAGLHQAMFGPENRFEDPSEYIYSAISGTIKSDNIADIRSALSVVMSHLKETSYIQLTLENYSKPELKDVVKELDIKNSKYIEDVITDLIMSYFKKYEFLFKEIEEQRSQTSITYFYEGKLYNITVDLKGIENFLINTEGDPIMWFEEHIVSRDKIVGTERKKVLPSTEYLIKRIVEYTKRALTSIVARLPLKGNFKLKTEGVHRVNDTVMLIVNGNTFIQATYKDGGVKFHTLTRPITHDIIVDANRVEILTPHGLHDLREFEETTLEDYMATYDTVYDLLGCWSWASAATHMLLAGYVCTVWVQIMFDYTMSPFFTAEKQSGKTKFLQFLSGNGNCEYALLPGSTVVSDTSAAGLRSKLTSITVPTYLDEFEPSNKKFPEILNLLRALTTGESKVLRGTASGGYRETKAKAPVGAAAINTLENDADKSRFTYFPLKHVVNHDDPIDMIRSEYLPEDINALSLNILRGAVKYLPQLRKAYDEMKVLIRKTCKEKTYPIRTSMNMCLPLAFIAMVKNYEVALQCFVDYIEDPTINSFDQFSESGSELEEIVEYMVSSEIFCKGTEDEYRSLLYYLNISTPLNKIAGANGCACVFKYQDKVYIAVKWSMFQKQLNRVRYKSKHLKTMSSGFMGASRDKAIDKRFVEAACTQVPHFNKFKRQNLTRGAKHSIIDITYKLEAFLPTLRNSQSVKRDEKEA